MEFAINPTIEPADRRAGSPQAKQLPGKECNPTNQQIIELKLDGARPYPPEQDPVFLITSPSHQEAYTSLSFMHQRADRRSKKHHLTVAKTKTILQKVNHNEKA